jgi:DNA repair protein RecO (recombination protein O)
MPTYTATGITLLARKFHGSRRVVTFYTREQGKVEAVAAGIGKPGSSLAGAVEAFTLARLFFAKGRNLDRLTQAQALEAFPRIPASLESYGYASWMAELTARATEPGQPSPDLFDFLLACLRALSTGVNGALVAAAYALALLELLGLSPVLEECARCGRALQTPVCYQAEAGGLVCPECGTAGGGVPVSGGGRGLLHGLRRLPPERLGALKVRPEETREVLGLLRRHLGYHLGLTLKSEEFLRQVGAVGPQTEE